MTQIETERHLLLETERRMKTRIDVNVEPVSRPVGVDAPEIPGRVEDEVVPDQGPDLGHKCGTRPFLKQGCQLFGESVLVSESEFLFEGIVVPVPPIGREAHDFLLEGDRPRVLQKAVLHQIGEGLISLVFDRTRRNSTRHSIYDKYNYCTL
jgi:hypothetical protein